MKTTTDITDINADPPSISFSACRIRDDPFDRKAAKLPRTRCYVISYLPELTDMKRIMSSESFIRDGRSFL